MEEDQHWAPGGHEGCYVFAEWSCHLSISRAQLVALGRVYIAARYSLGEEHAKQLIAICAAEQVENYVPNDVAMILDISESSVISELYAATVEVSEVQVE
jgi:hypothetical protein